LTGLIFPEVTRIRLVTKSDGGVDAVRLAGMAFRVQTTRCSKNDYGLGPFFSDGDGVVAITRRALELSAKSQLETGLMDYGSVADCSPDVELRHWTRDEIVRATYARCEIWTRELPGEGELYGSLEALLLRYRDAPNGRIGAASTIHDRWDGSRPRVEYEYVVTVDARI
jgi:hypothetical protein